MFLSVVLDKAHQCITFSGKGTNQVCFLDEIKKISIGDYIVSLVFKDEKGINFFCMEDDIYVLVDQFDYLISLGIICTGSLYAGDAFGYRLYRDGKQGFQRFGVDGRIITVMY